MNVTFENPAYDVRKPVMPLDYDGSDLSNDGFNDAPISLDEISLEGGRCREMAIDCPADFVPQKKMPPRIHSIENSPSRHVTDPYIQRADESRASLEQRIKKYQKDLKKRREIEEKQSSEDEFLRTSLRGSKKLQALEKKRKIDVPRVGLENAAFTEDDPWPSAAESSTDPVLKPEDNNSTLSERPCGVEKLILSFNNIKSKLSENDQEKMRCLTKLFQNPRLQLSVAIHESIVDITKHSTPVCHDVRSRCQDAYEDLPNNSDACRELKSILCKAEFQSLLYTHDRVACQYSTACEEDTIIDEVTAEVPAIPEMISDSPATMNFGNHRDHVVEMPIDVPAGFEDRNNVHNDEVRIVRLLKTNEPLGATVKNESDSVLIARIVRGGLAERSGLLHEGDEILEVNGQEIRGWNVNDVSDMFASMSGPITFCIIPGPSQTRKQQQAVMHIRALFSYDPEEDIYIPCRELGLGFAKCDILHVINQEDENWWQAYREGEEDDNQLAGLIPSKKFQEQREAMKQVIAADSKQEEKSGSCCKKRKKKKQALYSDGNESFDAESILTYEEVAMYYPQPNRKRPIVLIGPPNVGRQELRQRLMESDSNRFAAAVPHTSRPRKETEKDGQDYHFIPRQLFETDILQGKFIEYGEYEQNLYGTSIAAVQVVIDAGKICLLNVHPQSLKMLKASSLKPYVFFIAPPNLEKLRMNCHRQGLRLSEDGLREIISGGREIEDTFGHYFDYYLVNYDIDRTFEEIMTEINRLDLEPQWVPAAWLYS